MTPEAKAKQLRSLFLSIDDCEDNHFVYPANICSHIAKECALIAVNEIIEAAWWSSPTPMPEPYLKSQKEYWLEVKQSLENL